MTLSMTRWIWDRALWWDATVRCAAVVFLMDEAGIDIVVATSRYSYAISSGATASSFSNASTLSGLPVRPLLVYVKGRPDLTFYVGNTMEFLTSRKTVACGLPTLPSRLVIG